ncbi:MAG: hypothetical protein HWD83_09640 [Gammaproteobacteria bacterium]|nr:hypothetical protein [Gammaproteobacteria bacterium]
MNLSLMLPFMVAILLFWILLIFLAVKVGRRLARSQGRDETSIGVIAGVLSIVPPVAWLFLAILALLPSKPSLDISNHNKAV